eukprot:79593-Chlamydomonas_euryale.AAC.2
MAYAMPCTAPVSTSRLGRKRSCDPPTRRMPCHARVLCQARCRAMRMCCAISCAMRGATPCSVQCHAHVLCHARCRAIR